MSTVRRQSCSPISTSVGGTASPGVRRAAQPASGGRQPFERAHAGVGALVQQCQTGLAQQRIVDDALPALGTGAAELRHQRVAIAIDDQPRQSVGLAVHQAHAVAAHVEAATRGDRAGERGSEEGGVDALRLVEAPHARADARLRAERGPGEEAPFVRLDAHRLAAVAAALRDGGIEHPRMAAQQRAFAAGMEVDRLHAASPMRAVAVSFSCTFRPAA